MITTELVQAFLLSLQTVVLIVCARKAAAARRDAASAHAHAGSATHAAVIATREARVANEAVDEMKDMGAAPDVLPFPGVNPTGRAPWPGEREMAARAGIRLADLGDDQQVEENVAVYHHGAD